MAPMVKVTLLLMMQNWPLKRWVTWKHSFLQFLQNQLFLLIGLHLINITLFWKIVLQSHLERSCILWITMSWLSWKRPLMGYWSLGGSCTPPRLMGPPSSLLKRRMVGWGCVLIIGPWTTTQCWTGTPYPGLMTYSKGWMGPKSSQNLILEMATISFQWHVQTCTKRHFVQDMVNLNSLLCRLGCAMLLQRFNVVWIRCCLSCLISVFWYILMIY